MLEDDKVGLTERLNVDKTGRENQKIFPGFWF